MKENKKKINIINIIIQIPLFIVSSLIVAIPLTIAFAILFFIFGLICGFISPLGNIVDAFFTSLPFWNENWTYAWTLYFGIIFGIISGVIYMIYCYLRPPTAPKEKYKIIPFTQSEAWETMSTHEQDLWLRNHYPEYYGHAPNPTFEDYWKEKEVEIDKRNAQFHQWELERKLNNIAHDLDEINRKL